MLDNLHRLIHLGRNQPPSPPPPKPSIHFFSVYFSQSDKPIAKSQRENPGTIRSLLRSTRVYVAHSIHPPKHNLVIPKNGNTVRKAAAEMGESLSRENGALIFDKIDGDGYVVLWVAMKIMRHGTLSLFQVSNGSKSGW